MNTFYPTLRVHTLGDNPVPQYAHEGDAGLDLCAAEDVTLGPGEWRKVGSGIQCAIPRGYVGLVLPRSGLGCGGLVLRNTVGVIDSGYRGEVGIPLMNIADHEACVKAGDRVAQMLLVPVAQATVVGVEDLDETERGEGGFGSSGTGKRL